MQVKAGAKIEKIEKILHTPSPANGGSHPSLEGTDYKVWVKAPAKEGKANLAVMKVLVKYFKVPKSNVEILSGFKSKKKLIEISK